MKSLALLRSAATLGCGLLLATSHSPASSWIAVDAQGVDSRPAGAGVVAPVLGDKCIVSDDDGENGAKACFLDRARGNDDGLWVKDIDRQGSGVAYGAIIQIHRIHGAIHKGGETDGPDSGADRNINFDVGDASIVILRACVRNPKKNYPKGQGAGCDEVTWAESEG